MRTVTFKSLIEGVNYAKSSVPADMGDIQRAEIVEALNMALRHAWGWPDAGWPELKRSEQVTPAAGVIAWDATARTLGTVHGVYLDDPDTTEYPRGVKWRWNAQGSGLVTFGATGAVWVHYTEQTPVWSPVLYAGATNYATGTVRYDDATGECYIAIAATASEPVTNTAKWRKLDVPWIFRRAAVKGAVALLADSEEKHGSARVLERFMDEVLEQEWKQFTRSAGQHQQSPLTTAY